MKALNRDTIVAVILLLFCGAFYAASFRIEETTYATIGAEVWPRLILAVMFALSAIYLVQSVRKGPPVAERPSGGFFGRYRNAILCYLLFLAFLLTLDVLGMLLGGIAFVFLALSVLGERSPKMLATHAVVAIVSVGAMWSIFTFALKVILPPGIILSVW
ncbi:MAG: tripartite tricarboxylate transporter TctB family protein [Rhodospirillales bacterium]|nr:MAG: tripartite tricarboxylate transporter TctB family protein [Rhodospirillales bacterium]